MIYRDGLTRDDIFPTIELIVNFGGNVNAVSERYVWSPIIGNKTSRHKAHFMWSDGTVLAMAIKSMDLTISYLPNVLLDFEAVAQYRGDFLRNYSRNSFVSQFLASRAESAAGQFFITYSLTPT